MTPTSDTTKLFDALDDAAVSLLQLIDEDEIDADGKVVPLATIDRVKVFQAVVDYAATRAKVVPETNRNGPSKFDKIKEGFHGTANGGANPRRTRGRPTPPIGDDAVGTA